MKKYYLILLIIFPLLVNGQNENDPNKNIKVNNPFKPLKGETPEDTPSHQGQLNSLSNTESTTENNSDSVEISRSTSSSQEVEHKYEKESNVESSEKKEANKSSKKDNPFLETLGGWKTVNTNDGETIERFRQEEEWRKEKQRNDTIQSVMYVVIPILLVIIAVVFLKKILKGEKNENN